MNNQPITISSFDNEGYAPVVDFQSWRVAMLNYIDELEPQNIDNFQCHSDTDEVFVLLQGRCVLFLAELDEQLNITNILSYDMQPNRVYNIKRGVYHTHTLTRDAKVLIVENQDTCDENSPKIMIGDGVRKRLQSLTDGHWQE